MDLRSSVKWLILVLLTNLVVATVNPVSGAPYGEDSDALGQFVDEFTDLGNVSVAVNVVRNSTLDVMALNGTGTIIESIYNLTSLREHKFYGGLSAVVSFSIANNDELRMVSTLSAYDKGYAFLIIDSDWLDDLYVRFRWYPYSTQGASSYWHQYFQVYDGVYDRSNNTDFPTGAEPPAKGNGQLYNYRNADGVNNWYTKDFQVNTSAGSESNVTMWWTFYDAWNTVNTGIYLDWIEINTGAGGTGNLITVNFNNLSPITMEVTGGEGDYGFALSPELPFFYGGFDSEGYFTTVDYMADPLANGSTLALLVQSRIFPDTFITVQMSDDNATWGDVEGVAGDSHDLDGGLETIDLRPLNGSGPYYIMYNLTTTNPTKTPFLNQSRLITTEGPAGTTTTVDGVNWLAIALILGLSMVFLASKTKG